MDNLFEPVVTISLAVVALATVAVLVSKNANTAGVISAYGKTFSGMIGAATAPVSGQPSTSQVYQYSPLMGGISGLTFGQ